MGLLSNFIEERGTQAKQASPGLNIAVIGSSGGIGNALVSQFTQLNCLNQLYLCSRQVPQRLNDHKIHHLKLEFQHESSIEEAATTIRQQSGFIDLVFVATGLLHNDQGVFPEKSLKQFSCEQFNEVMLANAIGPMLIAKYFLPLMNKTKLSFFGALSARVGSISDNRLGGWHSYRASKAALNMLIKNLAIEYKQKLPRLIIAGLHPGTVDSHLSSPFQRQVPEGKLFSPDFSATHMLTVVNKLEPKDSGKCVAWDGKEILP